MDDSDEVVRLMAGDSSSFKGEIDIVVECQAEIPEGSTINLDYKGAVSEWIVSRAQKEGTKTRLFLRKQVKP